MFKNLILLLVFNFGFSQINKDSISLFFETNQFELNQENKQVLQFFIENKNLEIESFSAIGFCDDVGSEETNRILSKNRANSVSNFIFKNFQFNSISTEGKGEIALSSKENIDKQRAQNRRVEVVFYYKKIEEKPKPKEAFSNYKNWGESLQVGDKLIIQNLLFIGSSTAFEEPEIAEIELQKIVTYLQQNPATKIEIQGHVCCITKSFKDARDVHSGKNNLSETRAKRIYDYFISNKIDSERMTYKGYGRQQPIPNGIESKNKRVEIVILDL